MKSLNALAALPRTSLLQALHARGEALLLLCLAQARCREDLVLDPAGSAVLPAVLKRQVQNHGSVEGGQRFYGVLKFCSHSAPDRW